MMRENNDLQNSGGEELDIRTEFGDIIEVFDATCDASLPESLTAEALFMRFEGLLDETELEKGEPVETSEIPASDPPVVITVERGGKARGFQYYMPRILAVAACFVVALVGMQQLGNDRLVQEDGNSNASMSSGDIGEPASEGDDGQAQTAGSGEAAGDYAELRQTIYDIQKDQGYYYTYDDAARNSEYGTLTEESEIAEEPVADMAPQAAVGGANPATAGGGANGKLVYSTNTQEKGIDEADIIKTDGTYLYAYRYNQSSSNSEISIVRASNLKHVSTIDLGNYSYDGSLYLDGDYMILVRTLGNTEDITYGEQARTTVGALAKASLDGLADTSLSSDSSEARIAADMTMPSMPGYYYGGYSDVVEVVVYDISKRQEPEQVSRYIQDGHCLTSRYMNGVVYTVTSKGVWDRVVDNSMPMARLVPMSGTGNILEVLPVSDIIISPYLANPSYVTVSATDVRTGDRQIQSVLGVADTVYMSYNSLYLTATTYDYSRTAANKNQQVSYNQTGIVKIDVDGVNLTYKASAQVDGYVDGQFAFSEKDGYLRVATTADTNNGSINGLYVLDESFKLAGTLNNLAPGEHIKSVRYMGNMGYVVTFKQVDPLFAIDLSDPQNPVVLGELKIPGFSEYLHPIDENTLLGFGYNTVENPGGWTELDGLKLSLFDVSDPENPTETKSYAIGNSGSYSPAIGDHKAFMYYPEKQIVGVPVTVYTSSAAGYGSETFSGFLLFQMKKDGFELYGQIASRASDDAGFSRYNDQYEIKRGVYIGDVVYTFSDGCIMGHRLRSGMPKVGEYLFEP